VRHVASVDAEEPYIRRARASEPQGHMSRRGFVSACTLLAGCKAAHAAEQMSPAMPLAEVSAEEKEKGISDEVLEMPLVLLCCTVLFWMPRHSQYARSTPRILPRSLGRSWSMISRTINLWSLARSPGASTTRFCHVACPRLSYSVVSP
jgi:hypothetical protein